MIEIDQASVRSTMSRRSADRFSALAIKSNASRALPPRCREVLVLRKHHGLSHHEIAEKLGISPHTVNAQITIAMLKCREFFRAHGITRNDHGARSPTA